MTTKEEQHQLILHVLRVIVELIARLVMQRRMILLLKHASMGKDYLVLLAIAAPV
jgi:hypothetical protein